MVQSWPNAQSHKCIHHKKLPTKEKIDSVQERVHIQSFSSNSKNPSSFPEILRPSFVGFKVILFHCQNISHKLISTALFNGTYSASSTLHGWSISSYTLALTFLLKLAESSRFLFFIFLFNIERWWFLFQ